MKRFISLVVVLLCLLFSSCAPYEKSGLDRYYSSNSDFEITQFVENDFCDLFKYIDGDYFFYREEPFVFCVNCEKALLFFKYDENVYESAKEYIFKKQHLSENSVAEYNGYVFYDKFHGSGEWHNFPKRFMRFAYNDEKQILVFIGFYANEKESKSITQISENWELFLKEIYGDWYDFSQ